MLRGRPWRRRVEARRHLENIITILRVGFFFKYFFGISSSVVHNKLTSDGVGDDFRHDRESGGERLVSQIY